MSWGEMRSGGIKEGECSSVIASLRGSGVRAGSALLRRFLRARRAGAQHGATVGDDGLAGGVGQAVWAGCWRVGSRRQ